MTPTPLPIRDHEQHAKFSRRLEGWTIALGLSAALSTAFLKSARAGCGVAIGTLLAWLNYRWLDQGVGALVASASAQEGIPSPRVPAAVYWKFTTRYLLMGLVIYASVHFFDVPLLSLLAGLLALGAGAMAEGLYEVFSESK
jgi:ATP synthase I chain